MIDGSPSSPRKAVLRLGLRPTCWGGWDCRFGRGLSRASCREVDLLAAPRAGLRASPFAPGEAVLRLGLRPTGAHPENRVAEQLSVVRIRVGRGAIAKLQVYHGASSVGLDPADEIAAWWMCPVLTREQMPLQRARQSRSSGIRRRSRWRRWV